MADINILGHIDGIRYTDTCVYVTLSETRLGYKRADGVKVDNDVLTWCVVYKPYFKKYIASHFASGMLVRVKGIALPYVRHKDGGIEEGYTVIGQTIDLAAYPNAHIRREKKMIEASMASPIGEPNVEAFEAPDF